MTPGDSFRMDFSSTSSLAASGETRCSSSVVLASSRAQAAANRAGSAHHHGLRLDPLSCFQLEQSEAFHRVVGCPQGARGAVAVPGGDRQRGTLGHRYAGIAHHLGKGAQAHDLRAELLGDIRRGEQAAVGELRRV